MLYLSSTSNHNRVEALRVNIRLCYIFLLHQTTTTIARKLDSSSCVISFFYIKPQQVSFQRWCVYVVLYLSSTSNHNTIAYLVTILMLCYIFLLHQTTTSWSSLFWAKPLCYIFLLHQTTTMALRIWLRLKLCYIFLLHQTTTSRSLLIFQICCVISFFYIKPQLLVSKKFIKPSCVISFFYIKPQPLLSK